MRYVEDWFEYEEFDRAFSVLLNFGDELPLSSPWRFRNIDFWRIYARCLFLQGQGNFKYLHPISKHIIELLDQAKELIFIWPAEDIVTQIVRHASTNYGEPNSVSVQIDSTQLNPLPSNYHGDKYRELTYSNSLLKYIRIFSRLGALHLMLLVGSLLPRNQDREEVDLIYASPCHRELTETIMAVDSVIASTLPPRLLPTLRTLKSGNPRASLNRLKKVITGGDLYAEDLLQNNLLTVTPYVVMYQLIRSWDEFSCQLQQYLDNNDGPQLPEEYLMLSFNQSFVPPTSIKHYLYLMLFDGKADIRSITSVSGGVDQEFWMELGKKYEKKTIDLNHSTLMCEPPEIRNRADIMIVKGHPDMERLESEAINKELVLTGRPYNDNLYESERVENQLDVPASMRDDDSTVLVATEPIRDDHITRVLERTFQSEQPNLICIKLHPKESKLHYQKLLNQIKIPDTQYELVYDEYPLFDLIQASDAVVTISSNVGLEALALGIPGIHARVPPNVQLYYQTIEYFSPFVSSLNSLDEVIDEYLNKGLEPETVDEIRELYLIDGEASERVVSEVYE